LNIKLPKVEDLGYKVGVQRENVSMPAVQLKTGAVIASGGISAGCPKSLGLRPNLKGERRKEHELGGWLALSMMIGADGRTSSAK
jgi:hypothetical protein